jgi:hypothetical protein
MEDDMESEAAKLFDVLGSVGAKSIPRLVALLIWTYIEGARRGVFDCQAIERDGRWWVTLTVSQLCAATCLSPRSVQTSLRWLEAQKVIDRAASSGYPTSYSLTPDALV